MFKLWTRKSLPLSLFFSLLVHLVLLLSLVTVLSFQSKEKPKLPELYTPAYLYHSSMMHTSNQKSAKQINENAATNQPKIIAHKTKNNFPQRSILSMTYQVLQQNQHAMISHLKSEEEPIYLIGDKNSPPSPLIKLLGQALSAHFDYPREAGVFGTRGKALVGMTLHPSGHFTNVQLLQSTDNADLDAAALYAVNAAPVIKGVSKFISIPKHFVVGFIFR